MHIAGRFGHSLAAAIVAVGLGASVFVAAVPAYADETHENPSSTTNATVTPTEPATAVPAVPGTDSHSEPDDISDPTPVGSDPAAENSVEQESALLAPDLQSEADPESAPTSAPPIMPRALGFSTLAATTVDFDGFTFRSDQIEPTPTATLIDHDGSTKDPVIPGEVEINGALHTVTVIGEEAFSGAGLTSVTLPATIIRIERAAFLWNRLSEVTIPDSVVTIEESAFFDNLLRHVTLGASVDSIGEMAFEHYDWDADEMLPLDVTFTGPPPSSFVAGLPGRANGSFTDIDDVQISFPAAYAATIDYAAGYTVPTWQGYATAPIVTVDFNLGVISGGLQSMRVPMGESIAAPTVIEPYGFSFAGWYLDDTFAEPFNEETLLESNVTLYAAWDLLEHLVTVNIDGIIYMADTHDPDATASAVGLAEPQRSITIRPNVEIEGQTYVVTNIGPNSFDGAGLTSVTFPDTLLEIEEYAFSSYDDVGMPEISGRNDLGNLVIPDSVHTIGDYAFLSAGLTSVHLGAGLKHLGEGAFIDAGLDTLQLPSGLISIGDYAFIENSLRHVTIPGSTQRIGSWSFSFNGLESITIQPGVQRIDDYAFIENSITALDLPSSITYLGEDAFSRNSIEHLIIRPGLTSISDYAFEYNSLTSIELPDTITHIGSNAFAHNMLTTIELPASVTHIAGYAFNHNPLQHVRIGAAIEEIGVAAFSNECLCKRSFSLLAAASPEPTIIKFVGAPPTSIVPAGPGGSFGSGDDVVVHFLLSFREDRFPAGFPEAPVWHGYALQALTTVNLNLSGHGPSQVAYVPLGDSLLNQHLTDPASSGWVFTGWFTDAELTKRYDASDPLVDDLVLYAGWRTADAVPVQPEPSAADKTGLADTGASSEVIHGMFWIAMTLMLLGLGAASVARRHTRSSRP